MGKKIAILYIFITSFCAFSQNNQEVIDTLKKQLVVAKSDSLKAKIYGDLTWYFKEFSIDSALFYGKKGIDLCKKLNNKTMLAQQYSDIAGVYMIKGDVELSEKYFKDALLLRNQLKDTLGVAKINANISAFYTQYSQLDSAMVYGLKAMKLFEDKKLYDFANIVKSNIATLYQSLGNYEKSVQYNFEVLAYAKKIDDKILISNIYANIANSYVNMEGKTKEAIQYFELAIKKSIEVKNYRNVSIAYNGLTYLYFENNQVEKAIETAKEALVYKEYLQSDVEIARLQYLLGEEYFKLSNFKAAKGYLIDALKYYENQSDVLKLSKIYHYLAIILAFENDKKTALEYKIKSDALLDAYFNETNNKALIELEVKYESAKKEQELLKSKTEKAETELQLSKTKAWVLGLIASFLLIVLAFIIISYRNKRKAQEAITKEKERGFKAIIDAQEEERSKIARELHDGVVQQIGSVILKSRRLFEDKNMFEDKEATEVIENLESSNEELRNISHQMMPLALKQFGIITALDELLKGSLQYKNINHNLEHFNITERLPEKIEVTIYRITQELVNNIIKHSKATEVSVQLFKNDNHVILIVEDNGVGISKQQNKDGIGLLNIKSRLDLIHGFVNFEPSPSSGTLVTIKIPL